MTDDYAAYDAGPCEWCKKMTGCYDEDYRMYIHDFCVADYEADRLASRVDAASDSARDGD